MRACRNFRSSDFVSWDENAEAQQNGLFLHRLAFLARFLALLRTETVILDWKSDVEQNT